jgi:hypothetical protein
MVVMLPLAPGAEVDAVRLRSNGRSQYAEREADAWAPVVYGGLTPGRYAVGVRGWWNGPLVDSATVTVTEGLVEQRFVLPTIPEADYVLLRVLGPDGKDLGNPKVGMRYQGKSGGGVLETVPMVRQGDGRWRVPVRPGNIAEESGATVELQVSARGLGERSVDVSKAAGTSVVVRLDEPAVLTVEVTGAAGDPRSSGFRVDLSVKTAEGGSTATAVSIDPDGRHVFAPRQPGPGEVRLVLVRGHREWRVAGRKLDLASGPQRVTLSVPTLHRVTFTGAAPNTNFGLSWQVDGETENTWIDVDGDGNAVADGLPEGEYTIQKPEGQPQPFRVTGPTEVAVK